MEQLQNNSVYYSSGSFTQALPSSGRNVLGKIMFCEMCNSKIVRPVDNGRFCSLACMHRFYGRMESRETICPVCGERFKSKNAFLSHRKQTKHYVGNRANKEWVCILCGEKFKTKRDRKKHYREAHNTATGWSKGLTKENSPIIQKSSAVIKEKFASGELVPKMKGKHFSKEICERMSVAKKKSYLLGRSVGWVNRKIISYPEQFWMKVLENNGIKYVHNAPISKKQLGINQRGTYFLDFLIGDNIDLEIDGVQHKYTERKLSDQKRDMCLIDNGYVVYRIEWNEVRTEEGKNAMKSKISDFIAWIAQFHLQG